MERGRTWLSAAEAIGEGQAPSPEEVGAVCRRVLDGGVAGEEELAALLEVQPGTEQARVLEHAEEALARRGNGGAGYVYAQVGIDAGPCPGNCRFCSFAACNSRGAARAEVAPEPVLHVSELFAEQGVHLLSVMSSAAYDFERYLELVARIRRAVGDDMALMANTRDLSLQEARALAQAGADSIYHAVRIGEGRITGLDEAARWQTLENARAAGLAVSSAVGPLYQAEQAPSPYRQTRGEVVERMLRVLGLDPFCSGVTGLHAVPGTKMGHVRPWPAAKMRVFAGVFQLAARGGIPFGGYGSVRWVDAGLDPRERGYTSDDERLKARIAKLRRDLEEDGWRLGARRALP